MPSNRTQPDAGHRGWENPAVTLDEAYYRDPQRAYLLLSRAMMRQTKETEGDYTLLPMMGLIAVLTVEIYERHRYSVLRIWAKALRYDGRVDVLEYVEEEAVASAPDADPGFFESNIRWKNLDDQGKPITWVSLYAAENVSMGAMVRRKEPPEVASKHMSKMKFLYYALAPQIRVRIVNKTLEVNANQRDEATQKLGRLLLGLRSTNPVWDTVLEHVSPDFPSQGH